MRDECLKRWVYVEKKGGADSQDDSHLGSGYPSGKVIFKTKTEVQSAAYKDNNIIIVIILDQLLSNDTRPPLLLLVCIPVAVLLNKKELLVVA